MPRMTLLLLALAVASPAIAADVPHGGPVIDMHLHAFAMDEVPPGMPLCGGDQGVPMPTIDPREEIELRRGDRVAQLVVQRFEHAGFVEVDALPESVRGAGGYGSTGGFGPEDTRSGE